MLKMDDIRDRLTTSILGHKIILLDTVDSTNSEAKRRAAEEEEGTIILSEVQTAGRGRMGRTWTSPRGKGIWMSLILKPQISPIRVPQLTQVAAAAVCLGLEQQGLTELKIKWPNDILRGGRKLCGILTEMQSRTNKADHVILGIGLNVNLTAEDLPPELQSEATSLYLETGRFWERSPLLAGIINELEPLYHKYVREDDFQLALDVCEQRSALTGKHVLIHENGLVREAEALGLGSQGELLVRMEDGQVISLVSGEISLRIK